MADMPFDIDEVQNSKEFKALSPADQDAARQQMMRENAGAVAAPPTSGAGGPFGRGPATTIPGKTYLGRSPTDWLSYETYRAPATQGIANLIKMGIGGPQVAPAQPGGWSEYAAQQIFPQTPTDLGIQAALAATGAGEVYKPLSMLGRPLARLALPAIGGMIGSTASGKSPVSGLIRGEGAALTGEALRAAAPIVRWFGGRGAEEKPLEGVARAMSKNSPVKVGPADVEPMLRGNTWVDRVTEALDSRTRAIRSSARGIKFEWPRLTRTGWLDKWKKKATLEEVEEILSRLGDQGHLKGGGGARGNLARESRELFDDLKARTIKKLGSGLGAEWEAVRNQIHRAFTITRLMGKDALWDFEHGILKGPELVTALRKGRNDLVSAMGEDLYNEFVNDVTGGGQFQRGMATVPGERPRVGFRGGLGEIRPHASTGTSPRIAGRPTWAYPPRGWLGLPFGTTVGGWIDELSGAGDEDETR